MGKFFYTDTGTFLVAQKGLEPSAYAKTCQPFPKISKQHPRTLEKRFETFLNSLEKKLQTTFKKRLHVIY